jgi:hypothetical protein
MPKDARIEIFEVFQAPMFVMKSPASFYAGSDVHPAGRCQGCQIRDGSQNAALFGKEIFIFVLNAGMGNAAMRIKEIRMSVFLIRLAFLQVKYYAIPGFKEGDGW